MFLHIHLLGTDGHKFNHANSTQGVKFRHQTVGVGKLLTFFVCWLWTMFFVTECAYCSSSSLNTQQGAVSCLQRRARGHQKISKCDLANLQSLPQLSIYCLLVLFLVVVFFLNARQIGWSAIAIGGNKQCQSKIRQSRHNSSPGFFVRGKGIIISSLANGILFSILRNFATMSFPTENGDWICNCGVMNFKSRSACRMCSV